MKTEIKNSAAFLAVAIWADGVYATEEKDVLVGIAEALGLEHAELAKNVEESLAFLEDKDEDAIQAYLVENASAIDEEEAKMLMQCAIDIVLADNVITQDEVQTLFDLADATGVVEHSNVALMLVDLVKYSPEVEIEF